MNKTLLTVAQVFAILNAILFIFPLGLLIFPLVLAYFNFKAASVMDKAKRGEATKEQVTNYSIYLIFTSMIGGICGLIAASSSEPGVSTNSSIEQRLKELDDLYDRGVISKQEYDARRGVIIASL